MQSNLRKDYIWNTIGVLLQNAMSPLLLVVVTRVNGIDDSGIFSFAFAISVILWSIALWGGRTYQVSDTTNEFSLRGYVSVRALLGAIVIILAVIFSLANGYNGEKTALILALTVLKVAESLADVIYGILQVNRRLYISGVSLAIKTILGAVVFSIALFVTKNLILSAGLLLVSNIATFIFYDLSMLARVGGLGKTHKDTSVSREAIVIMRKTLPVFAMSILSILSLNIPRYFLDTYHPSEIGFFGILAMPVTLLTLLIVFILQPSVVSLSDLYAKRRMVEFNAIIKKISTVMFFAVGLIMIGSALFGVPVLNVIFGVDFSPYWEELLLIILGGAANMAVGIMTNTLTIMRRFKQQFFVLLFVNALLAAICALVVPAGGMMSAVLLYTAANLIQALALVVVYQRFLGQAERGRR